MSFLPRRYGIWLGGATVSLLGSQIMGFGLTWSAAGQGGAFAGAVLTAVTLPRALLILYGGALADRIGAWRVMITADVAMAVATAALAGAALVAGVRPGLLLAAALAIGIVDAFYLPASGSMPRRLVPGPALARAMSARQAAGQLATFAGPPAGGLIVATAGLPVAAFLNAATFLGMAAVLLALRPRPRTGPIPAAAAPPSAGPAAPSAAPHPATSSSLGGLRVAWADPLLRPALGLTAAAAAFLLPVPGLLLTLLAGHRGWTAGTTGVLAGAAALGTVAVAVLVTAAGALPRPGLAATAGLALAGAAVLTLAFVPTPAAAAAAAAVSGLGTGLFGSHVGPLLLAGAPPSHLARVQSVLVLVQSVPLLLTNNVLGHLTDLLDVDAALLVCATALLAAAALGARTRALRTASLPVSGAGAPGQEMVAGAASTGDGRPSR